jgi:hypothetical protein
MQVKLAWLDVNPVSIMLIYFQQLRSFRELQEILRGRTSTSALPLRTLRPISGVYLLPVFCSLRSRSIHILASMGPCW